VAVDEQNKRTLFDDVRSLVEAGNFRKATLDLRTNYHLVTTEGAKALSSHGVIVHPLDETIPTNYLGRHASKSLGQYELGDMTHIIDINSLVEKLGGHAEYVQATQGAKDLNKGGHGGGQVR
jgi:hypothetical protein